MRERFFEGFFLTIKIIENLFTWHQLLCVHTYYIQVTLKASERGLAHFLSISPGLSQ